MSPPALLAAIVAYVVTRRLLPDLASSRAVQRLQCHAAFTCDDSESGTPEQGSLARANWCAVNCDSEDPVLLIARAPSARPSAAVVSCAAEATPSTGSAAGGELAARSTIGPALVAAIEFRTPSGSRPRVRLANAGILAGSADGSRVAPGSGMGRETLTRLGRAEKAPR